MSQSGLPFCVRRPYHCGCSSRWNTVRHPLCRRICSNSIRMAHSVSYLPAECGGVASHAPTWQCSLPARCIGRCSAPASFKSLTRCSSAVSAGTTLTYMDHLLSQVVLHCCRESLAVLNCTAKYCAACMPAGCAPARTRANDATCAVCCALAMGGRSCRCADSATRTGMVSIICIRMDPLNDSLNALDHASVLLFSSETAGR